MHVNLSTGRSVESTHLSSVGVAWVFSVQSKMAAPRFKGELVTRTWPMPRASDDSLRVACYNIRVDHSADEGTGREWVNRRPLASEAIRRLDADLILLQAHQ